MLSDACLNTILDAFPGTFASLHTAYSTSGANEATGGAPAYARKSITYGASAAGSKASSNAPVFDVAAATYRFVGFWTAVTAGTFLGMAALGSSAERDLIVDVTNNKILSDAHGFVNTDKIVFLAGGATVPTGLTEGTVYFVITSTTNDFQVSLTSGGAAISITGKCSDRCKVAKIVEEVFGAQGTLTLSSNSISLLA
jgi:hypothetical protein